MATATTLPRGSMLFGHRVKRRRTRSHKAVKLAEEREEHLRPRVAKMMAQKERLLEINSADPRAT